MQNTSSQSQVTRLREFRAALIRQGLSLEALGRAVHVDASHLRRIVLGQRRASRKLITKLRAVVGDAAAYAEPTL